MIQAVIESGRAEFALNAVKKIAREEKESTKKEYKSYARKFPTLIQTNGLAASVAYALEKGGTYKLIYGNISDWLVKNGFFMKPTSLEEYICSLDSDSYRIATNEVLALFDWLRRFASGLIEGEDD